MDNERSTLGGLDLVRWVVVAALVLGGVGLFFVYGRGAQPVVTPSAVEAGS